MEKYEINQIPEKIASGEMSKSVAIHKLALYLSKNAPIFGLNKKDEDFKSEVILYFLEKGEQTISLFNPDYGSFFTYFFCFIKSIINTINRNHATNNLREYHNVSECISHYEQDLDAYEKINYHDFDKPKVPYSYKKISPEAFQIACKTSSYHVKNYLENKDDDFDSLKMKLKKVSPSMAERILLVLALKSSYYISDKQIKKISEICCIDFNLLQDIIQTIKDDLEEREHHKEELELRRNKAYYQHKKYKSRLEWKKEKENISRYEEEKLLSKYNKQTENWNKLNSQLKKGTVNIRPTNKTIAKALGMCERQISYYIKYANIIGIDV